MLSAPVVRWLVASDQFRRDTTLAASFANGTKPRGRTVDRVPQDVQMGYWLSTHPSLRYVHLPKKTGWADAFVEVCDLRRLLKRAQESSASLQEVQIWRYFAQVCDGIRHMHEARVMHRDIKVSRRHVMHACVHACMHASPVSSPARSPTHRDITSPPTSSSRPTG